MEMERFQVAWPANGPDPEVGQSLTLVGLEGGKLTVQKREPSGHITAKAPNGDILRGRRAAGKEGFYIEKQ